MGGQAFGFRIDQEIAPRRRFDFLDLLEVGRPGLSRNLQELQRILPIFVEQIRHQPVQRVPPDAAGDHVVHQPREVAGQRKGRCGSADDQRRGNRTLCPQRHQSCQREPAVQFPKPRWNVERGHSAVGLGLFRKRQLVLVDVAERDDTGQQHGVGAEFIEKHFPHHAPGTAGRKVERRLRQSFRMRAGLKAIDQPAIDQRGDDGAQERR